MVSCNRFVQACTFWLSMATALDAFLVHPTSSFSFTHLNVNPDQWERDIETKARRRAPENTGIGETAAGAVLGGLLLGPFGALFGASLGSNIGAKNAMEKARQAEMEKLGLDQKTLEMAREVGMLLERSNEGLQATQESLNTQQRLAKRLDQDVQELFEKAQTALKNGDEERARDLLMKRTTEQELLKKALINCADEKKRMEKMEENVKVLERKAMEVESLVRRSVSSKALIDTDSLSLQSEDPLLRKFKDLGID